MNLTVATIVKNEADRFLESALKAWTQFADRIVVLDDGSTDDTGDLCKSFGCEVHRQNPPLMFGSEWKARRMLWRLAADRADWVLHLDADQVTSCDPKPFLKEPGASFKVYDLWGDNEYREDAWWTGHLRCWWPAVHVPSLPKGFKDEWPIRGWHSGHVPINIPGPINPVNECSILHYAYSKPELREHKAKMYHSLGSHLTDAEKAHARSIMFKARTKELPFTPNWKLTYGRQADC